MSDSDASLFLTKDKVTRMKPLIILNPKNYKASKYMMKTRDRNGKRWYIVMTELWYYSDRYDEWVVCQKHFVSDGATGAYDINSFGWLFHDKLCNTGTFNDTTPCTNWQASTVIYDILKAEGYWFRARSWRYMTFGFGGGKARKNGMLTLD